MAYDSIGRKLSESLTVGGNTYLCSTQYDDANRVIGLTYPDGSIVQRGYTDRNQIFETRYNGALVNTRIYDPGRRLTQSVHGNGVAATLNYRLDNLLEAVDTPSATGNESVGSYSYTYDANKNKTSESITGTLSDFGFGNGDSTVYDDENRLMTWNRNDGNLNRQWDLSLVGDWNGITENGTLTSRTYSPAHEITSIGADAVTHDAKGNLTNLGDGRSFAWDFDNRLSSATVAAGSDSGTAGIQRYTYDALGRRVSKLTGGQQTICVCAGQRVICEYTAAAAATPDVDSPTQRYVHGDYIDELILKENHAGIVYYHRNQQYSVVALTDASGSVVERYSYTAYGKTAIHQANGNVLQATQHQNDYTYTGRRADSESGLMYFRARYYDPATGEFISRDPLEYVDGMSLYRGYFVPGGADPFGLSYEMQAYRYFFGPIARRAKQLGNSLEAGLDNAMQEVKGVFTQFKDRARSKVSFSYDIRRPGWNLGIFKTKWGGVVKVDSDGCCVQVKGGVTWAFSAKSSPTGLAVAGGGSVSGVVNYKYCWFSGEDEWKGTIGGTGFVGLRVGLDVWVANAFAEGGVYVNYKYKLPNGPGKFGMGGYARAVFEWGVFWKSRRQYKYTIGDPDVHF